MIFNENLAPLLSLSPVFWPGKVILAIRTSHLTDSPPSIAVLLAAAANQSTNANITCDQCAMCADDAWQTFIKNVFLMQVKAGTPPHDTDAQNI